MLSFRAPLWYHVGRNSHEFLWRVGVCALEVFLMLKRYDHGGDVFSQRVELDFSVNVNPLGMPAAVRQAVIDGVDSYATYPDPQCRKLRAELGAFLGVPSDWIVCGNGAADLIIRTCLILGPAVVAVPAPTFSEYEKAALMAGADVKICVLKGPAFAFDDTFLSSLRAFRPDMFFLCNPNNPTGVLTSPKGVETFADLCEELGTWFVVDECFLAFTDQASSRSLLPSHPHMIVLDAFTKMYAMAGLRLGFIVSANPELVDKVARFGQSWNVSGPAQAAGSAAVGLGEDWIRRTREYVRSEGAFLHEGLRALGFQVWDGAANYTMFKSEMPLVEPMLERGILIRSCSNYTGLDGRYFRVGLKGHAENVRLLEALREVVKG